MDPVEHVLSEIDRRLEELTVPVPSRRRVKRRVLRAFGRAERPAAWCLLLGGAGTFVGVVVGLITVGDFRVATLLVAADLTVSGFQAVQQAEDDEDAPESRA